MNDTMGKRLERAAWEAYDPNTPWGETFPDQKEAFRDIVRGVLREMLEPSEGMVEAGTSAACLALPDEKRVHWHAETRAAWQAMLQYILDER